MKNRQAREHPIPQLYILSFPLVMGLVFYLTFNSLGPFLSGILSGGIHWWTLRFSACLSLLDVSPILHALIIDGICSGVGSVLSFLPVIAVLFFCLSMLRTCGYLDLVAAAMDRPLSRLGLSGAALIPLLTGFGCAVPAVMAAGRLPGAPSCAPSLSDPSSRPRRAAIGIRTRTIFMIPFLSCSARLPIYTTLTADLFPGKGGLVIGSLYLLGIAASLLLALLFRLLAPSCKSPLRPDGVAIRTQERCPTASPAVHTSSHAAPPCPAAVHTSSHAAPPCPDTHCSAAACPAVVHTSSHAAPPCPDTHCSAAALRPPDLRAALKSVWGNVRDFTKKAFTVIFLGSMAVWLLENLTPALTLTQDPEQSLLAALGRIMAPVFGPLGFGDWRAVSALIAGLSAKEAIVSTLAVMARSPAGSPAMSQMLAQTFTPLSAYSFMTFCLLYIPCIATLATVKKELGSFRPVIIMIALQIGIAWIFSFLLYHFGVLLE